MKESLELVTHVSRLAPSVRNFLSLLVVAVTVKMNRVPKMASILEIKGDIWVSSKIGRLKGNLHKIKHVTRILGRPRGILTVVFNDVCMKPAIA